MEKVRKMYRVTWDKSMNMWKARIKQDGTEQFLGYFAKIEDAKIARKEAEAAYQKNGRDIACVICGAVFKLKIRDKRNRCYCHSPVCEKLWTKYRKIKNDYDRGARQTLPSLSEWKLLNNYKNDDM